jgi:hypothetical protein
MLFALLFLFNLSAHSKVRAWEPLAYSSTKDQHQLHPNCKSSYICFSRMYRNFNTIYVPNAIDTFKFAKACWYTPTMLAYRQVSLIGQHTPAMSLNESTFDRKETELYIQIFIRIIVVDIVRRIRVIKDSGWRRSLFYGFA